MIYKISARIQREAIDIMQISSKGLFDLQLWNLRTEMKEAHGKDVLHRKQSYQKFLPKMHLFKSTMEMTEY